MIIKKMMSIFILIWILWINITNASDNQAIVKNTVFSFCESSYIGMAEYSEVDSILSDISELSWIYDKIDAKNEELISKWLGQFKDEVENINKLVCNDNYTENQKYQKINTLQKYLNDRIQLLEDFGYANILYSALTNSNIKDKLIKFYQWRWDDNSIKLITKENYNKFAKDYKTEYNSFIKYKNNNFIKEIINYKEVNNMYRTSWIIADNFVNVFWNTALDNFVNINKITTTKWKSLTSSKQQAEKIFPWKSWQIFNITTEEYNKYKNTKVIVFITSWDKIKSFSDKYTGEKVFKEVTDKYNNKDNSYLFVCLNKNCFVKNLLIPTFETNITLK